MHLLSAAEHFLCRQMERDYQEYISMFTGSSEMIREGYTPNKVITPSLVRLPGYTLAEFCLNMVK